MGDLISSSIRGNYNGSDPLSFSAWILLKTHYCKEGHGPLSCNFLLTQSKESIAIEGLFLHNWQGVIIDMALFWTRQVYAKVFKKAMMENRCTVF